MEAVVDRFGNPAGIENICLGGHVFLILGGPSFAGLNHSLLSRRGVITFGINNVGAVVRPNFWTYGDTSGKFHDAIWTDPYVMKFCPEPKLNDRLRTKLPNGEFRWTDRTPRDCPNVYGIFRNSVLDPENWLWENTINWGNGKEGEQKNGLPRTLSTMFQAVRLCYYLGFRQVYLLGCDFTMSSSYGYSFQESRSEGAVRGNNNAYVQMQTLWSALRPHFDRAGFRVLNVNPKSGLTAFDYIKFEDAIEWACHSVPKVIDTDGWYESLKEGKKELEDDE